MKIKDGDTVELRVAVPLKDYFYCAWLDRGQYHSADILPGTRGKVIRSHTPCVTTRAGEPYFANIDVDFGAGQIVRIRPLHSQIKLVSAETKRDRGPRK